MKSAIILALFFSITVHGGENQRSCRIIFPMRPPSAPAEAYLFDGSTSRKVELPTMNFSDIVPLAQGRITLTFTKEPVTEGVAPSIALPRAELSADTKDAYLVILSDPSNRELPLKITVVDAGNERLKPGHTLWLNLSDHRIEGDLGMHSFSISSDEQVITPPPLGKSGYYKAEFRYQPDQAGPFLPVMKKSWWLDIQSKNLGFIMSASVGSPRIFAFRDHRIPQP